MAASPKPIVATTVMTEFGEVLDDGSFYDAAGADGDLTYVPGYSDLRRERDRMVAKVRRGEAKASEVPMLPVRLHWVRSNRVSGEPDSTKQVQSSNDGYREVTVKDISPDNPWLKDMPPGAHKVAGGAIRKGDVTLMVCEAPRAARNAARVRQQTDRLNTAAAARLMAEGDRVKGCDPTYESKLADKPIGQD